ncbi:MAG: TIM barrel protein [Christensenellales bacterium]|jgi:sugar phosphate isomerase/epimerase
MILALAGWHYPQRTISQNMDFFLSHGFDAFSAHGVDFIRALQIPMENARCGEIMSRHGKPLTVHYKLPDPNNPEEVALFKIGIPLIAAWQREYGCLQNLTFDFWHEPRLIVPFFKEALKIMEGTGVTLACEDYPLNAASLLLAEENAFLFARKDAAILIDVGHMFLRFRKEGKAGTLDNFIEAFTQLPFPVAEMHIHNNDGITDRHALLEDGCLPVEAFARWAAATGFKGVMTIESVPRYHGFEGAEADKKILRDLSLLRKWIAE